MQKITLALILFICLTACKSKKTAVAKKPRTSTSSGTTTVNSAVATKIIDNAEKYKGVRYKYGGTTSKGMDCSGLVYTAFKKEHISIPRSTKYMATAGKWIDLKEVEQGDLLFFATKKNYRTINHVGLVISARVGHVEFIHSTTSKGVITSNLSERYWYFAFVQARRIL